jgi:Flp pilus assembly secretin CpaC
MTTLSRLPGLCAIALVVTTSNPQAQAQAPQGAANPAPQRPLPAPEPSVDYPKIKITAGRSTVMSTDFDITRIAITNPAIADGVVVQPREILIDGKSAARSA